MSLGKKIEVEPLSDARWSKIESSLFEKLEREQWVSEPLAEIAPVKRRSWKTAAVTLLAFAAALALVVGGWRAWGAGAGTGAAPSGATASNPSRIVTGMSDSHLALGESSLDVAPESALVVSGDDARGLLVVLDRGKVSCEVAPRHGRPPFLVQAGGVRVRVIGTRFTVTRGEGDSARVEVAHGLVEVSARGETILLHDGESWPPVKSAAAPTATNTTTSDVAIPPPAAVVSADDPSSPLPPSTPSLNAKTTKRSAPSQRSAASEPASVSASPSPLMTSYPDSPAPPSAAPSPTPQQLFEQAAKLESRDPSQAIAIYRRLSSGGGAWAMNALFAQGRLEADRGNPSEARRLLSSYLSRYPRGPNAADARALLERLK